MKTYDLFEMRQFLVSAFLHGRWHFVHRDIYGNIVDEEWVDNIIPNEGIDYILNAAIHGDTQISAWYFAPFTNDYTPTASDTYASPGYTEATSEYSESTRQEWVEGAASGQQITNSTAATITAATDVTIYGAGLVGGGTAPDTKGDTSGGGVLLASAALASPKSLSNGETLDMTYTITGSSS